MQSSNIMIGTVLVQHKYPDIAIIKLSNKVNFKLNTALEVS